jgi:hypothetical protein
LEAGRIKALVALHVRKQAGVEPAATRTGDTGSSLRFEGGVLAVERRVGKVQIEIGLNPCAQVLGRKQVRFLVVPGRLLESLEEGLSRQPSLCKLTAAITRRR